MRRAEEGVCDEVVKTAHGTAMLTPSLPLVWQVNAIRVEDPQARVAQLTAEADEIQAAFGHRKLVMHDERLGKRLAPELAKAGWNVFRVLIMLRRRPADRPQEPRRRRGGHPRRGGGCARRLPARAAVRLAGRGGAPAG